MAFEPILWKDRQIERPNTFTLKNNPDGTYTLIPVPGTIFEPGTALSAQTLNLMQDKIKQEFNTVSTQLAENMPIIQSSRNTFSGNLRIAYHFNYENNQEKIDLLKSLGFNCIYMYRNGINNSPWQEDTVRMKAFLDRMLLNGIYVILSIDRFVLESTDYSVYSKEQNWITALESHNAVIGFATYDEPYSAQYPQAKQNLLYNRIKQVTKKDVFMTEHMQTLTDLINYHSPIAYDVLCIDNYSTFLSGGNRYYDTAEKRKKWLFDSFVLFENLYWSNSPKRIIPVLPFFSLTTGESQYGLITKDELQEYLDVCSLFNFRDYGVFAFDVSFQPSLLTDTLDTNVNLQKLCSNLITGIYKSKQEVVIIKPQGFSINKNYISSSNMTVNLIDFEKLSVIGTSSEDSSITFKVDINSPSTELCVVVRVQNKLDVLDRQIRISYSTDGINFISPYTQLFNTGIEHVVSHVFTIPKNLACVHIKVELNNFGHSTSNEYLGITHIASALI